MATRLNDTDPEIPHPRRRARPFVAWLCFFLGLTIVSGGILSTVAALASANGDWTVLKAPFSDYQDTMFFRRRTAYYFTWLSCLAAGSPTGTGNREAILGLLESEGENLRYCLLQGNEEIVASNLGSDPSSIIGPDNMPVLPMLDGYGYYWYFDGQKVRVFDDGAPIDTERLDSGYRGLIPNLARGDTGSSSMSNVRILLAVRNPVIANPYGSSRYYADQRLLYWVGRAATTVLALGVILLAYGIAARRERREFDLRLALWSGRMWFELKVILSLLVLGTALALIGDLRRSVSPMVVVTAGALTVASWWTCVVVADLRVNGKRFFTHNSLNWLLRVYRQHEQRYTWQKVMLRRAYAFVLAEAALFILLAWALDAAGYDSTSAVLALLIAGIGVYVANRYLRRFGETVKDLGRLMDHIRLIKGGDTETRLRVAEDADIYPAAQDLNDVQQGIGLAVNERVKSERMKVDLITNVSHDLKTPLTSIVSYVDLLAKEEGLPEHVNDYIRILAQKTERLKNLIQDLFELSKATSNDISLDLERIDLARLARQVLADMEESIHASCLVFRTNVPDEPTYIISDGAKLYRVLQNLISNALKYSLQGSRVFLDLTASETEVVLTLKNTANYEMNFDEETIMQRFVRGDRSRSTEGSGLGLSIAKSFTEACGGRFNVTIDGDLFKVELRFEASR
ncbi:MAG: sensor histidine kinase [Bacillota bacterium]